MLGGGERRHLRGWNAEIGRLGISNIFFIHASVRVFGAFASKMIDLADRSLAVSLEHMLELVAQHEPEVVQPVVERRHANDRSLVVDPRANTTNLDRKSTRLNSSH